MTFGKLRYNNNIKQNIEIGEKITRTTATTAQTKSKCRPKRFMHSKSIVFPVVTLIQNDREKRETPTINDERPMKKEQLSSKVSHHRH